jgi:PAS domain S-box-containing protein
MLISFREKLRQKELQNLRLLNVVTSVIVTVLGFVFEFAYHDGFILCTGLLCSMICTANYFLSYYNTFYRVHFTNITYITIFILHIWAVYIVYVRDFEISFLLPVSISAFTFSLIFNRFYKSLFFIFSITTFMFVLMLVQHQWQSQYTIVLIALYSGAFLSQEFMKRKSGFYSEIQKQEKRYLSLVENMNDGFIYLNEAFKVTYANDKFCNISGYSFNEIIDTGTFNPLIYFKDGNSSAFNEKLKEGENVRNETKMQKKNGETVWVQMSATPHIDEEKFLGTLIVCTDISPLKDIQENLKRREEGYRSFIDQSAVGIWRAEYENPISVSLPVADQVEKLLDTGYISECNDFMAKMYGYNHASELIGRRIRDFYHVENNFDDQKAHALMRNFISNEYRISNAESKELDKNGVIRYMLNNNIGIIENGFLIRTWGVQTDITERKRTEKELLESNQELDTFFYKASHDLKGPLASVMGIVNLARLEFPDEKIDKYFSMIETSVKRLDRTLMDLIEIARTRKGAAKVSIINIRNLTDDILASLKHFPGFSRIKFEIIIDPSQEICADKVLVLSVFQNLIQNAINYCNQNNPQISIQTKQTDKGIELKISDNGKGIPDHIKSRVFEMFYRGHPDSTGSGLGLFIVRNALDKMKGSVTFESVDEKGTTFTVYFPNQPTENIA